MSRLQEEAYEGIWEDPDQVTGWHSVVYEALDCAVDKLVFDKVKKCVVLTDEFSGETTTARNREELRALLSTVFQEAWEINRPAFDEGDLDYADSYTDTAVGSALHLLQDKERSLWGPPVRGATALLAHVDG